MFCSLVSSTVPPQTSSTTGSSDDGSAVLPVELEQDVTVTTTDYHLQQVGSQQPNKL